MTHDSQLLRLEHGNRGGEMTDLLQHPGEGPRGMSGPSQQMQNPVARVRSIMHGRWKYAIPLAVTCAAAGAWLGFMSKVPKYRSSAQILFSPVKISPRGDASVIVGFGEYVNQQCVVMHSQRELNLALQEPAWRETHKGNGDEMISDFGKKLDITSKGGLVAIEYIDEDKDIAYAAVKSTVSAYKKLYQETDPENTQAILKLLDNDRVNVTNQLTSLSDQKKNVCGTNSPYTPDTLEKYYGSKVDEMMKTEAGQVDMAMQVGTLRAQLRNEGVLIPKSLEITDVIPQGTAAAAATQIAGSAAAQGATPAAASTQPSTPLTPEVVAQRDVYMAGLLGQQRAYQLKIRELLRTVGRKNAAVIDLQNQLDTVNEAIDQRMAESQPGGPTKPGIDPRLVQLDNLIQNYRQLQEVLDHLREVATDLGGKVTQLQRIKEEQEDLKRRLDTINQQYTEKSNEYQLSNRAQFLSEGDKDYMPYEDKRKSMAAFGGAVGTLLGFGSMFLLGLLDQRVKTISDAKYTFRRSRRVLGILPTLPDNLGDPRQAAFAAHCVHHVRNLLQLSMSPDRGAVMAVTSASPGEGKTSLTLSLGLSFAAANSRTLLIDCDVVGGGLTARVNAIIRRKMGDVLKRQGVITESQLTQALALVQQKNIRLGEALIELGFLSAADIDSALSVQKETLVGLLDVLDGEPLNSCITAAGSPNLFILPRGNAVASNSGQVSAKAIRRIIAEARAQYDVVLIDTGPVLGSLEASIVASEADGVVLAVSRGQQKTLAERAMELLDSIGANTAGIVFNRAQTDDMETIQYSSSIPASALQSIPSQSGHGGTSRMGPIAFAVASATNQSTATRAGQVSGPAPTAAPHEPREPKK